MKRARGAVLTGIALDPELAEPLYQQLYLAVRQAILDGTLPPGTRLPSTRTLAEELEVSRNTVKTAFEQLLYEGYIDSRVGAGSFVTEVIPESVLHAPAASPGRTRPPTLGERRISERSTRLVASDWGEDPCEATPFAPGFPCIECFPLRLWNRLLSARLRASANRLLAYGPPQGYGPLREAIASYLNTARGVRCEPEQVIVVSSSQQALDLASQVLLDPGDQAWLEEPGYLGARGALMAAGADIAPVPVDDEGLRVDVGRSLAPHARVAYVTPSHQYPLGSVMSLSRRLQLIEWAEAAGAWILEDDYDSELRYRGRPIQALQGLDGSGRVLYIGTFTKVMFPGLRLAYLVAPRDLFKALVAARKLQDGHSPLQAQAVTADFLDQGHFATHLRRMRSLYLERQEILRQEIETQLGDWLTVEPTPAGMHLVARFIAEVDDCAAHRSASAHGLETPCLSRYYLGPEKGRGLLLGYSGFREAALRDGVKRLRRALEATCCDRLAVG